MRGSYLLTRPNGTEFEAKIAEFALTQPHALH
jgi:ApaG protein